MRYILIFLCFFYLSFANAQSANFDPNIIINSSVDSTSVKIGEEIIYTIDITSKNKYNIRFDEKPNFIPFEILDSYPYDSIIDSSKISKKYSLIKFDPGEFWIPPQKVYFDQSIKFTDSILIVVNDVEVDTLKQNLYDIKPIIPVKRNYQKIFLRLIFIIIVFVVAYLLYRYYIFKNNDNLNDVTKSLYEIAFEKLENLNSLNPDSQIEFKEYYTILVDIFREYLESQVKIPAMESTSRELITRINMLKDSGNYNFEKKQIDKLEELFTKSDLIKFAKSLPTKNDINIDLITIKNFINSTEKIYNEKFEKNEEPEVSDEKINIVEYVKNFLKYSLVVITTLLIVCVLIFGYYPVRDTILLNPTKKLLDKEWFTSQYGSPPIELSTPLILERVIDSIDLNKFQMGRFEDNFYLSLDFKDVTLTEDQVNLDLIKNGFISELQELGSKNILVKDDQFTVKSGDTAIRLYGSLDIEFNNDLYRSNFTSIILPYEKKTIKLIIVYRDNDRYASDIESKILKSIDIIKEL